jgi:hypothetical protein
MAYLDSKKRRSTGYPKVLTGTRGGVGAFGRAVTDAGVSIDVGGGRLLFGDLRELADVTDALASELQRLAPIVRRLQEADPDLPPQSAFQRAAENRT